MIKVLLLRVQGGTLTQQTKHSTHKDCKQHKELHHKAVNCTPKYPNSVYNQPMMRHLSETQF